MSDVTYRSRLLLARNVLIYGLKARSYTINDILDIGYEEFNMKRQVIFIDNKSFKQEIIEAIEMAMLDIKETLMLNYQMVHYDLTYDLFDMVGYIPFINDMMADFLCFFSYHEIDSISHIPELDELLIVYDGTNTMGLTREQFKDMLCKFSILNFANDLFKKDDRIKKSDDAKKFDEEVEALKKQFGMGEKEKEDITFDSILSWLCNDGNGYTHENIGNKTIYQIMDSYCRRNYMGYCDLINMARGSGICNMEDKEIRKITYAFNLY